MEKYISKGILYIRLFCFTLRIAIVPFKVSATYVLIGSLWILFSDRVLAGMIQDSRFVTFISTIKGWFFVLMTGLLLYFYISRNMEDGKKKEMKLLYYDRLTNLPNRLKFEEILKDHILKKAKFSVLLIDLDNFKGINNSFGYAFGDALLKNVAGLLDIIIKNRGIVSRFGEDEFAVLLPHEGKDENSLSVASRIINSFHKPWILDEREFYNSASIGIVKYPENGDDPETLLKNVDVAMYHAKNKGKDNFLFYDSSMNSNIIDKIDLESKLRKAIENEEFLLYYQPIVHLETQRIEGLEALLRWNHPQVGLISPEKFIPIAEETGLIIKIGEWVLNTACRQNKKWQEKGYGDFKLSVNISAKQFQRENLKKKIENILIETSYPAHLLDLEITESTAMMDIDYTVHILKGLRQLGLKISLDDFGTGYSSLNYLKKFPIHSLKIDKSFVNVIAQDSNDQAIAEAVIKIAHKMNISVVAEGVECRNQMDFLREYQCDHVQGYYFSRPLPPEEIEKLLSSGKIIVP